MPSGLSSPFDNSIATDGGSEVASMPGTHTTSSSDSNLMARLSLVPPPPRFKKSKRKPDEKPTALLRAWVRIDPSGQSSVVHADKMTLSTDLGIQVRDLRLLESQLANQTSVILCRERAILINMAFVKAIITTSAVFIVSPDEENAIAFMNELKARLQAPLQASKATIRLAGIGGSGYLGGGVGGGLSQLNNPANGLPPAVGELPFELRALEICLDELTCDVDERARQLERVAYPAVDAMAKQVQPSLLERVRRIKTRLVALHKVTETFHEVLEALLDDDKDMWEMNLTAKEAARRAAEEVAVAALEGLQQAASAAAGVHTLAAVAEDEVMNHGSDQEAMSHFEMHHGPDAEVVPLSSSPARPVMMMGGGGLLGSSPSSMPHLPPSREFAPLGRLSRRSFAASFRTGSSSSGSSDDSLIREEVQQVEMLLEAYFMHIDNVYNRLTTLSEYIEDTEDLVNIQLDAQRNRLISCDLVMSGVNTFNMMLMGVSGLFTMNLLHSSALMDNPLAFREVAILSSVLTYLLLGAFIVYYVWKGVMRFTP